MKILMLGACLAAVLVSPALAQPYDPDPGGYPQDQQDQYRGDQDQGGYNDNGYRQDDRGYQDDQSYRSDGYNRADRDRRDGDGGERLPPGAHYTGEVGSSWRDADGRNCAWRQLTWPGADGNPAYKWVARCRD